MTSPDIICITETWLSSSIDDSLVYIPCYEICRSDRAKRRGGGSAIYVNGSIGFVQIPFFTHNSYGVEGTVVCLTQSMVLIMCIYIPPNIPSSLLREFTEHLNARIDELLLEYVNHDLMIAGDFNHLNPEEICVFHDLIDLVKCPTRLNNTLDHILVSRSLSNFYCEDKVQYGAPLGNSDHKILTIAPHLRDTVPDSLSLNNSHRVFDFRQSNVEYLLRSASCVDWDRVVEVDDVNVKWNNLEECLQLLLECCIPMKYVQMSNKDKEWITPLIKHLINARWEAYRCGNWSLFNHLKVKVKHEIMKSKQSWANKLQNNTKGIWELARRINNKNRKSNLTQLLHHYGSPQVLAEKLALHFATVAPNGEERTTNALTNNGCSFRTSGNDVALELKVSAFEVRKLLLKVSPSKSSGRDQIPSKLYVLLADFICKPLATLIEASFTQGKFPAGWKKGIVIPVPKQRPNTLGDFRPITLHPLPSKICEKILRSKYIQTFEDAYGYHQHGFRRNASTTTALITIVDAALKSFDEKSSTGTAIISLDLSKAFDCLDHELVVENLRTLNFSNGLISWIQDYLRDRSAIVRVCNDLSKEYTITRGIPQGTVLGPMLFNTFVSDFRSKYNATVVSYADDINIIMSFTDNDPQIIENLLKDEVYNAKLWCSRKNCS